MTVEDIVTRKVKIDNIIIVLLNPLLLSPYTLSMKIRTIYIFIDMLAIRRGIYAILFEQQPKCDCTHSDPGIGSTLALTRESFPC